MPAGVLDRQEMLPSLDEEIGPDRAAGSWDQVAAIRAGRVAVFAGCLAIVGLSLDACFWLRTYAVVPHGHLYAMAVAAGLLAVLYGTRRRPREWLGTFGFCAINAAILAALWRTDARLIYTLRSWTPFEAQRLGALTVALLTPPRAWVGVANIAAFTLVPIVEVAAWDSGVRGTLSPAAPFASLTYGLFACGLLALQLRRLAVEQRDAQRLARGAAVERFAGLLLAVRDLANTPLQIIELTVARVGRGETLDARATERLRRACERLIAIAHILEEGRADFRPPPA
jgi:hypothetical protein